MSAGRIIRFPRGPLTANGDPERRTSEKRVPAQVKEFLEGLPLSALLLDEQTRVLDVNERFREEDPFAADGIDRILGQPYEDIWRRAGKSKERCRGLNGLLSSLLQYGIPFHVPIVIPAVSGQPVVVYGSRMDLEESYILLVHFFPEAQRPAITPEMQQIGLLLAEQEERRRIARELHDETFQQLTVIQFGLDAMKTAGEAADVREACRSIEDALAAVQHQVRTLSFVLHPPELDTGGLATALERFVKSFGRRAGLSVAFTNSAGNITVEPEAELALYRVAQEALANVLKHAEATHVKVRLRLRNQRVILEVEDNGVGIPQHVIDSDGSESVGIGLSSMRERIAALAGRLSITQQSPGTLVSAGIPCRRKRDIRKD